MVVLMPIKNEIPVKVKCSLIAHGKMTSSFLKYLRIL